MTPTQLTNFRLDAELLEALRTIKERDGLPIAVQVRRALETWVKVKVVKVNTMNVHGKARRQRTSQAGRTSDWKKAIVTLKEGDKIILT